MNRSPVSGVSISFVHPILKRCVFSGLDQGELLREAGIDPALLQQIDARLTNEAFEKLTILAAEMTGDPAFGLHQGQAMEVSDLGLVGYVMQHSQTLGQAMEAYGKYNAIVCSGFHVDWEQEGEAVWITLAYQHTQHPPTRHCVEDIASSIHHILQRLSCRPIPLLEASFAHGRGAAEEEYRRVFGIVPQFGRQSNRLRYPMEIFGYPVLFADSQLRATFEGIAEDAKDRLLRGRLFSDELYAWMLKSMPGGLPALGEAAVAFAMSTRSLQAKLQQEQTTYQEMLNRVRQELAASYLAKPGYKISEVAYLLGFSEPSAFQNAFKKWTGQTPKQYRLAHML
ncbi:AraC family transcriptional regulator [Paenibacillus whitsoniae]|nr:AraC family transcriptional regulator [Paenibacillus whitsoniae]